MNDEQQTLYDVLHVSPDAPDAVIKASYRTLMQQLKMHPDLGGDSEAAAAINAAYAILGKPGRRADYDASLLAARANRPGDSGEYARPDFMAAESIDPYALCVFCRTPHQHGRTMMPDARCASCRSPLAPHEARRFEQADQRAIARVDNKLPLRYFVRWPQANGYEGRTEDVSLSGLRLTSGKSLKPGQVVKVECSLLDAVAIVRNHASQRRGFVVEHTSGLSFVTLLFNRSIGGFVSRKA